jgi:hypothetical protein
VLVFLDFEASSLGKTSYPIEVAWAFEDGRSESYLIRPAPQWIDWDEEAEAIHGIAHATLMSDGVPHDAVAERMIDVLTGHALHASAPSWDGKWLSTLLRAAGLPRHSLRLKHTEEARHRLAADHLCPFLAGSALEDTVAAILEEAREIMDRQPVRHRALEDAERERQHWMAVGHVAAGVKQRLIRQGTGTAGVCRLSGGDPLRT